MPLVSVSRISPFAADVNGREAEIQELVHNEEISTKEQSEVPAYVRWKSVRKGNMHTFQIYERYTSVHVRVKALVQYILYRYSHIMTVNLSKRV